MKGTLKMKKLLAAAMAVLTAAVMAGCGNTADEQLVEDISGDTSVTAEAEAAETEETSKAAETSVTEAEGTTAETESVSEPETTAETTVPETEHTTEAETTTEETAPETTAAKQDSAKLLTGRWTESRAYIYDFDEKGNVSINTGYYNVTGTYTCENDRLLLSLADADGEMWDFAFKMTADNNGFALYYEPVENEWGFYDPYEPAGLMGGYFSALWDVDEPFYLKKGKEPRPADIKDLDGIWIDKMDNRIYLFEENRFIDFAGEYVYTYEYTLENGRLEYNIDGYDMSSILWLYGDKIYMNYFYSSEPCVLEHYKDSTRTISLKDFEGYSTIRNMEEGGCFILELEKGKGTCKYDDNKYSASVSVTDSSKVSLKINGEETVYDHFIIREEKSKYYELLYRYIYLYNDEGAVCINNQIELD